MLSVKRLCTLALGLLMLQPAGAWAVDEDQINAAVQRGVQYLKSLPVMEVAAAYQYGVGPQALLGVTLLECGVPPNDPVVQRHVQDVRQAGPTIHQTYTLALAILFLDRLGDPEDIPLIQLLGLRLLSGQRPGGGWSYTCPVVGGPEALNRLRAFAQERQAGPADEDKKAAAEGKEADPPPPPRPLPRDLLEQVLTAPQPAFTPTPAAPTETSEDNSNTQFAILGLWAARRHGVPVEQALLAVGQRFRATQNRVDGGWAYTTSGPGNTSTPAMTCAGLLGLAVAYGSANEVLAQRRSKEAGKAGKGEAEADSPRPDKPGKKKQLDPGVDEGVRSGLLYLANLIGRPHGRPVGPRGDYLVGLNREYYFLWSLERVAMAYNLQTIGKKDWYAWGAEILVEAQRADGSWRGGYAGGGVDTCFALLFLRKSNLAADLSARLRGRLSDPGETQLRAGGVGGAALQQRGPGPLIQLREKEGIPSTQLSEAVQLAAQLVRAGDGEWQALLRKYRDSKGGVYTEALVAAIPQLQGAERVKVREALAERLARMTPATLRGRLKDQSVELRRAAALACAMKDDRQYVPDLIELLQDPEQPVHRAAHAALKELTQQDFGPRPGAGPAEVEEAIAKWRAWWQQQGK